MRQTTAPQGPPGGSEAARTACAVRTAARRACGRAARGGRSGHALRVHVPPTDFARRPTLSGCVQRGRGRKAAPPGRGAGPAATGRRGRGANKGTKAGKESAVP